MSIIENITRQIQSSVGDGLGITKTLKLDFGKTGVIFIDNNSVTNENRNADATLSISLEDFINLASGKLEPQLAMISGKMKISGDISAIKGLGKILNNNR